MNEAKSFVDDYLAYLLARASQKISNEFHATVEENGLSLMEWRLMASLWANNQSSIGELTDIVLAKQPTVTKLVGRMVKAGWVTRAGASDDKRRSLVSLTEKGKLKVSPLIEQAKDHEKMICSNIGGDEMKSLKTILKEIIATNKAKRPTVR